GRELRGSLSDRDLVVPVISALRSRGVEARASRRRRYGTRVAILAAVIVLALASAAFATYRVVFAAGPGAGPPAPPPALPVGRGLDPGAPVGARNPRGATPVGTPLVSWLRGTPEWWFEELGTDRVSLTFPPQRGLPEIATSGVGLLIQEFDGEGVETVQKYLT